jgi:hypothetical protein
MRQGGSSRARGREGVAEQRQKRNSIAEAGRRQGGSVSRTEESPSLIPITENLEKMFRVVHPGVKKTPDPGSASATLVPQPFYCRTSPGATDQVVG